MDYRIKEVGYLEDALEILGECAREDGLTLGFKSYLIDKKVLRVEINGEFSYDSLAKLAGRNCMIEPVKDN